MRHPKRVAGAPRHEEIPPRADRHVVARRAAVDVRKIALVVRGARNACGSADRASALESDLRGRWAIGGGQRGGPTRRPAG